MAELKDTIVGAEKVLSMKQVVVGAGGDGSVLGPTIMGAEKVLSMKQVVVEGEGKNQ